MSFNNGNERRKLNAEWEHLRVQYREAGMSEDTIQAIQRLPPIIRSTAAYAPPEVVDGKPHPSSIHTHQIIL